MRIQSASSVKQKLRKGLWSPEEDEKLFNHMARYGINGCWSSIPKLAGLQRCGKSCRLRWLNYLRPDLKRGTFSQEEEDIIINLHRIVGNRWAHIAIQLPGRTDNEIKNFWNSYLKKKLIKQGIDPATHKPLVDTKVNEKKHESLRGRQDLPSLRAHEPTFLINDTVSSNNTGLLDSSKGMDGSFPVFEFQEGLDKDVYNPNLLMSQYDSNWSSFLHHNHMESVNLGSEFSSMPSLINFENSANSKQYSSNGSSISSYNSGIHQMNEAPENEALYCLLDFQVKSEEGIEPCSWQIIEEQLIPQSQGSSADLSNSYQLASLSEVFTGSMSFSKLDQVV